jgi:hypothetical protein
MNAYARESARIAGRSWVSAVGAGRASLLVILTTAALAGGCGDDPADPVTPRSPRLASLTVVSGNNQTGEVGTILRDPLVVRLRDTLDAPVAGVTVNFFRNNEIVAAATTDALGVASVQWTLATRALTEEILAQATLQPTVSGVVRATLTAVAAAGPPARITLVGDGGLAAPNASVDTIAILAADRYENQSGGAPVTWSVTSGGGSVRALDAVTGVSGTARAIWVLGPAEGEQTLSVTTGSATATATATATVLFPAASVVVGHAHSCALTRAGVAYCWGANSSGQLGLGRVDDDVHVFPRRVVGGLQFASITAEGNHTCGVTVAGFAYCWGASHSGQAGTGMIGLVPTPTPVASGARFLALAAGTHHTCGITTNGDLQCWGDNALGQLGDGSDRSTAVPISGTARPLPVAVAGASAFVSIASASVSTCAISSNGSTYCWGSNFARELGESLGGRCHLIATLFMYSEGGPIPCSTAPVRLNVPNVFTSLSGSRTAWCGVGRGFELVCWGNSLESPRVVSAARVTSAWIVGNDVCGPDLAGTIACWGVWGATGFPTVPTYGGETILGSLASGAVHSCGVSRDARSVVYCWGFNASGQLGDGTTIGRTASAPVAAPRGV